MKHALGSGGEVEVMIERPIGNGNTRSHVATRVWGEAPRLIDSGTSKEISILPSDGDHSHQRRWSNAAGEARGLPRRLDPVVWLRFSDFSFDSGGVFETTPSRSGG